MISRSRNRALETACWSLGAALITLYFGARAYGELERRQAISAFAQTRLSIDAGVSVRSVGEGGNRISVEARSPEHLPNQAQWSASRILAYAGTVTGATASELLPAALLRIRSMKLEVPVYADTSERNLNRGAGLIAGTAGPDSGGNVAIAAHRDGYFRALKDVAVGDVVELESFSQVRRYRVTQLAIVEPSDIWPLHETDVPTVTLVTCYPFYFVGSAPQRFIVRAVAEN